MDDELHIEFPPGNPNDKKIRVHAHKYERAGLHEWDNERVMKLADDLGITLWMLCAVAGAFVPYLDKDRDIVRLRLNVSLIRTCWRTNKWPILLTAQLQRLETGVKIRNGEEALSPLLTKVDNVIFNALQKAG